MKESIYEILKELVSHKSISATEMETGVEKYVYDFLKDIPYFQKHPDLVGFHKIPNDPFGRCIPYGLIIGNTKDTVILSGHIDVVSTEVYGEAEDLACTIGEELEEKLSHMDLNELQRRDMESGEWIWGRGVCDMKGGIAIAMYLVKKYAEMAEKGNLEGSILFSAVADEESYSAGMRAITTVYLDLKKKYDLNFKLLLDPEPAGESGDAQVMSLGTVGKTLPVIMVQGELAHIGHSYNGINPLNILTGIYKKTNGSLDFVDTYEEEASLPPAWQNLRDMKDLYDASIPFRAAGYMTILSFDRPLDRIMDELCGVSEEVFKEEVEKLNCEYQQYKKMNHFEKKEKLYYEPLVYTVGELSDKLRQEQGDAFDAFYEGIKKEAADKVAGGASYPDATIFMMRKLMTYADIKQPYVLIGIAPPYYPPTHSDMIEGREGFGSKVFEFAKELSEEEFGQKLTYEHYFTGISDNSYTSLPDIDGDLIASSYPMWGKSYSLDFDSIKAISVPSILYGPIGREYHQWTERVNKRSLLEVMPHMIDEVVKFAWKN
jgi:arginine utilization protein RocB